MAQKTAFELDFEMNMRDAEFRAAYERSRAQIDAIDNLVRALDTERAAQGLSKAELARRMDVSPEAIRRLFSTERPNPTMKTYVAALEALDLKMEPVRRKGRSRRPVAA